MQDTARREGIRMCIDRFVPEDRISAAEADALAERPDNLLAVPLPGGRTLGRPRMALISQALWKPGTTITVRFMDGEASVQSKVQDVAKTWEDHANLRFDFGDHADATIRISFADEGSWSYLGTVAQQIPSHEPTMNYGWLTPDSEEEEYWRVVLHEFGHAMGAIHEHQSPDVQIPWDKEAVYAYYARQGWSRTQVDNNLFRAYSPEGIQFSRFDPESIMLYAVDNALTVGDWEVGWNTRLSEHDKSFIASQYPAAEPEVPELKAGASPVSRTIGGDGQADRFQFAVNEAGRFSLETHGPTDVVMSLHGPDNESSLVAVDDDSGLGLNAHIERELTPGRYFVQVRHFHPSGTGSYELSLERLGG
ncbi:MAG TPA: peptidase [Candidatus Limnocylindria bacterium]|nr:peptidase [Candidatus Limnocylindria bacterium]